MNNFTIYGILVSFDTMIDITYNLYGVTYNCYYGSQEAVAQLLLYGDFVNNPSYITYNLVYNFGLMYNSIKDVILFFSGSPLSHAKNVYAAGFEIGAKVYHWIKGETYD